MKFLGFIATEGSVSTEPVDTCLSCLTEIYSNVSVCPVVHTHLLGSYFNACNVIENKNRMQKYDIPLEKYWIT